LTPSKFGVLGVNDPRMETFHKFLSEVCVSPTIHMSWPNVAKIGRCEVAEKSSLQKRHVSGTLFSPHKGLILPPISRLRPKFCERCRPSTCACVLTLVRIGCGLPDLFRKESKKVKTIYAFSLQLGLVQIYYSAYNKAAGLEKK